MGVNASGDRLWRGGHGSSLPRWVGVDQPAGTADKTTRGLLDRLRVGHFRPTGRYRVGDRARSTDRYQDNLKIESVSRSSLSQTWPGHPPGPWSPSPRRWWIPGPVPSSLPVSAPPDRTAVPRTLHGRVASVDWRGFVARYPSSGAPNAEPLRSRSSRASPGEGGRSPSGRSRPAFAAARCCWRACCGISGVGDDSTARLQAGGA